MLQAFISRPQAQSAIDSDIYLNENHPDFIFNVFITSVLQLVKVELILMTLCTAGSLILHLLSIIYGVKIESGRKWKLII